MIIAQELPAQQIGVVDIRCVIPLLAALKWTINRESDAADIIQRLAFRADVSSEIGERAREHAAELKRLSMRLDVYVKRAGVSGDAMMVKAAAANNAIAALDQNSATIVLVRYLIQHAEATSEILEGVGKGLDAKAIQILCRKVAREKQKIAAWIERHGHAAAQH